MNSTTPSIPTITTPITVLMASASRLLAISVLMMEPSFPRPTSHAAPPRLSRPPRQKVRFLQDSITAYEDQAWGDGDLFDDYRCSPGVAVDRYRDGVKWKVLISLRETKHRGDVTDFRFTRRIHGGFTGSDEWWQTELGYKTQHLLVRIIFPTGRPCRQAMLIERNAGRTTDLGPSCFALLPDGRQVPTWEIENPSSAEFYTIRWKW